jgi:hypothetical protein
MLEKRKDWPPYFLLLWTLKYEYIFMFLSSPVPCYLISLTRARVAVPINHTPIYIYTVMADWVGYTYAHLLALVYLSSSVSIIFIGSNHQSTIWPGTHHLYACVCLSNESFLSSLLIRKGKILFILKITSSFLTYYRK